MRDSNRPIVVGIDGSSFGEAALSWAAGEAALRSAPLVLVYAFQWPLMGHPISNIETVDTEPELARQMLLDHACTARELAPRIEVGSRMIFGSPARTLLEMGRGAEMVVVGSRGLGGFAGLLAGSVSLQVAEHSDSPAVVVRASGTPGGPILVGLDGHLSEAALGWAFDEAARHGATLLAVHAWAEPDGHDGPAPDLDDPVEADASERLFDVLARWRHKYPMVPVTEEHTRGHPVPVLLERAATARLMVVGSRGRGGFAGLLLGSTSQGVLRHAPCPVAVIRSRT